MNVGEAGGSFVEGTEVISGTQRRLFQTQFYRGFVDHGMDFVGGPRVGLVGIKCEIAGISSGGMLVASVELAEQLQGIPIFDVVIAHGKNICPTKQKIILKS